MSIQYAKSVTPIVVEDDEITRVCPTKFDPKKPDKQTEMGRKKRVPFAVYVAKGSVSARLAEGDKGTGFSDEDLQLLKDATKTLFLNDESTARPIGSMIMQKGVFFTHNIKRWRRGGSQDTGASQGRIRWQRGKRHQSRETRKGERYGMLQDIARQDRPPFVHHDRRVR